MESSPDDEHNRQQRPPYYITRETIAEAGLHPFDEATLRQEIAYLEQTNPNVAHFLRRATLYDELPQQPLAFYAGIIQAFHWLHYQDPRFDEADLARFMNDVDDAVQPPSSELDDDPPSGEPSQDQPDW